MLRIIASRESRNSLILFRNLRCLLMALLAGFYLSIAADVYGTTVMIVAPHPDDEALSASGVIAQARSQGYAVKVVVVTNGDACCEPYGPVIGNTRQGETVRAMSLLQLKEDDVIFLGYPDGALMFMFNNPLIPTLGAGGVSDTYGIRGLGRMDYHAYRNNGKHGLYVRETLLGDLVDLLKSFLPDEIYAAVNYDDHPDHAAVSLFVKEAISTVMNPNPKPGVIPNLLGFAPVLYESMIWAPYYFSGAGPSTYPQWPSPVLTPDLPFDEPGNLYQTPFAWNQIINRLVPDSMRDPDPRNNLKRKVISEYLTANGNDDWSHWLFAFVKKNEIFWRRDYQLNLAPYASATVSTENQNPYEQQYGKKAIDGIIAGYPGYTPERMGKEWASVGQKAGAWIKLDWNSRITIGQVTLHDRPNTNDQVTNGTLTFFDGNIATGSISVGALPNNGAGLAITFPPRTVTGLRFGIGAVSSSTVNIGLAEIEVLGKPSSYGRLNADPYFNAGPYAELPGSNGEWYQIDEIRIDDRPRLTAKAWDIEDGQRLRYKWSTDGGFLRAIDGGYLHDTDATAVFTPPSVQSRQVFTISTTIDDRHGRTATNRTFLTVIPTASPAFKYTLQLSTDKITEGGSVQAVLTLEKAAPAGGTDFVLSSDFTNVASVPASITLPEGTRMAAFRIDTFAVKAGSEIKVRIKSHVRNHDETDLNAELKVVPLAVKSLQLNAKSVNGGQTTTGTVELDGTAPFDVLVSLRSSRPSVVSVDDTAKVPAGSRSVTFSIKTQKVANITDVEITAAKGGHDHTEKLRVAP